MTMQAPTKSVSEIVGRIAEALDAHLGSPAWRGNASVKLAGAKITFTDNAGAETELDLSGLVPAARPDVLTAIGFDAATRELLYKAEDGQITRLDLSSLGSDVHISDGSYDPETMRLTLRDSSPDTPDVVIDFSGLVVQLVNNGNGTFTFKDGRGDLGTIDFRPIFQATEHTTGELWIDGTPVLRAVFDLSTSPDGTLLVQGASRILRQYGACSDGVHEFPAPQDHDGNTFQAARVSGTAAVVLQRGGFYAVPKPGEYLVIEFVRPVIDSEAPA